MWKELVRNIPGARSLARAMGLSPGAERGRGFLLDLLPRHSVGAEIGVHEGDFSRRILDRVAPRELHLIDPWQHQASEGYREAWYGGRMKEGQRGMDQRHAAVCDRFRDDIQVGRVTVHRGYSADVLKLFDDAWFDWVYIDGNHLYEHVREDLELSLRKTRAGGLIAGDDYAEGGWWEGGVKRAVDGFEKSGAVQLIVVQSRQFVFRKTP